MSIAGYCTAATNRVSLLSTQAMVRDVRDCQCPVARIEEARRGSRIWPGSKPSRESETEALTTFENLRFFRNFGD
jgi:hypothetical protein